MKSVLKEILIILLLCLAICLILGVIFYEYIPTNKVIPSTVEAYTTSNSIKEEISQEIVDYPKQNIVLEITESDLNLYEQQNTYTSGKANPFANVSTITNSVDTTNSTTGGTSGNTNSNSTGTYFNNTGLK